MKIEKKIELRERKNGPAKGLTLVLDFEGVDKERLMELAVRSAVIDWQNGPNGRARWKSYQPGQRVVVKVADGNRVDKEALRRQAEAEGQAKLAERLAKLSPEEMLAEVQRMQITALRKAGKINEADALEQKYFPPELEPEEPEEFEDE